MQKVKTTVPVISGNNNVRYCQKKDYIMLEAVRTGDLGRSESGQETKDRSRIDRI